MASTVEGDPLVTAGGRVRLIAGTLGAAVDAYLEQYGVDWKD
jgi:hypothetical protein